MYQTIDDFHVLHIPTQVSIPHGHRLWGDYEAWLALGNKPKSSQRQFSQVIEDSIAGIQSWIDATAQQNGYDNAVSCVSYANSTVDRWRQDAQIISAWRDAVWQAAHSWRDGLSGQIPDPVPTIDEIITQLPQPESFGWEVHQQGAGDESGQWK